MLIRSSKDSSVIILNRDEYNSNVMSILNESKRFIIDNAQKGLTDETGVYKRVERIFEEFNR